MTAKFFVPQIKKNVKNRKIKDRVFDRGQLSDVTRRWDWVLASRSTFSKLNHPASRASLSIFGQQSGNGSVGRDMLASARAAASGF
jgi:hypothetical protein